MFSDYVVVGPDVIMKKEAGESRMYRDPVYRSQVLCGPTTTLFHTVSQQEHNKEAPDAFGIGRTSVAYSLNKDKRWQIPDEAAERLEEAVSALLLCLP